MEISKIIQKGNSMKCRIIKRTNVDGKVTYIIQQKHFLFKWLWIDTWYNHFGSIHEAKKHLCYYDGSKPIDEIIEL